MEVRDAVKRAAKELAGQKDAGVRLEIPYSLQPSLKALEAVSYHLKQKNPGLRRNIKFDDQQMDLVLDFNPDPENRDGWRTVTAAQALEMKKKIKTTSGKSVTITDDELSGMMDIA